ncbi:MAG: hypothetical protein H8E66_33930 [Planctomycetes bacterium]|nr:hypothetical protein [Planctomycetota bacterium]
MTTQEILAKVASGEVQPGEAATLIAAMNANGKSNNQLTYKVSPKGAMSVYGMGRFPVTLYAEQWERIDSDAERKRRAEFMKSNAQQLTRKS